METLRNKDDGSPRSAFVILTWEGALPVFHADNESESLIARRWIDDFVAFDKRAREPGTSPKAEAEKMQMEPRL